MIGFIPDKLNKMEEKKRKKEKKTKTTKQKEGRDCLLLLESSFPWF